MVTGRLGTSPGSRPWRLPSPISVGTTPPDRKTLERAQYDLDQVRLNAFRIVWALVLLRVLPSVIECAGEVVINVRGPRGWLSVTVSLRDLTIAGSALGATLQPPGVDDDRAQELALIMVEATGAAPYSIPHDAPWFDLVTSAAERASVGRDPEGS